MKLLVNGSSSAGNSYVLKDSDGHMLLLECGIEARAIKRSIDYDLSKVDCCVVSHCHSDHARALPEITKWGVPVMGPAHALKGYADNPHVHPLKPLKKVGVRLWTIFPFPVMHDVPCFGYIIEHDEMGKLLFITDTITTDYRFSNLRHILIECNYDEETLRESMREGITAESEYHRLTTSHMELNTTLEILRTTDLSNVDEIVLVHTSSRNADPERYREIIVEEFGKPVHIARRDLELGLDLRTF